MVGEATAEALNISLPKKTYQIPAGDLSDTLPDYAAESGILLGFDPILTQGKRSATLKGQYGVLEGFDTLLKDSGLEVIQGSDGRYQLRRAAPKPKPIPGAPEKEDKALKLEGIEVRAKRFYEVGPLPGLGLTKEEIPGNVQSISAKEIKEAHALSLTDLMNRKLQSVTVNDYQGNPFQMDVQYRGFTAGPQIGTPQGLSVFIDGIRVNEPFGDVVNWDMIPMNALSSVDVFPGSNPIFGLNTLGGAFSLKTKDGFNNAGADVDILTGSFGRKQLQLEGGWNNGTVGIFAAGNLFLEDGWRKNSPSRVNQLFSKASYRGDNLDLNLSTLLVQTDLTGNGLLPTNEYEQNRNGVYTSPDTTKNNLAQFQLSGSYFVNDKFSVTGQVYRRNSKRKQRSGDVFTDYADGLLARRRPGINPLTNTPEEYTCLFNSTNPYGIPDYYLVPVPVNPVDGSADLMASSFFNDLLSDGVLDQDHSGLKNATLSDEYVRTYQSVINYYKNFYESAIYNRTNGTLTGPTGLGPDVSYSYGTDSQYVAGVTTWQAFYSQSFGGVVLTLDSYINEVNAGVITRYYVVPLGPTNEANCASTQLTNVAGGPILGGGAYTYQDPNGPFPARVDGIDVGQPGVVDGTPTGIITNNQIDQIVDGFSLQLNWNLDKHKFMVGASLDSARADYTNDQQLAFINSAREVYLDPSQAHPQFAGAFAPISNNNFDGTSITKSLYFSDTWTPVETLHFTAAGRYNQTRVKNTIAARYGVGAYQIGDLIAIPDNYNICPNGNCAGVDVNYRLPEILNALDAAETEKFTYYSFNPSLGMTWQAKENLNFFANIAQGTRTPSVIELGCAYDDTPVPGLGGALGPRSIVENRFCSLPTTLSGDPFLKQIRATTYDIGLRGMIGDNMQWNLGAYQTDLRNDIYFIAVGSPGQGFFDNVGRTRRRGLEAGLSGRKDEWRFSLNYALTEATFQDTFDIPSDANSSSNNVNGLGTIRVTPGSRMPGVPLQNLNASANYDVTDKWTVGLSMVAHSDSYLRGNENNQHQQGIAQARTVFVPGIGNTTVYRQPSTNPGKVSGYATFNFQTSYKLGKEWTATMMVNNLFDKEYFSAGRLGRNPFSPSILGAVGTDGYNHNSGDWLSTNFIAPGAPRGVWFSLNWHFVPD
ncbi:MAG: TonB-dependent receptor domain-containing protein [Methylophilus sp.]|uniref:TonB-dependent receptor domain-containing protein n=1 Tax=Methylophilus sp. TaxID=29541 RepID=UPI003FA16F5D